MRGRVLTRPSRLTIVLLAVAASLAALPIARWLLPAGNQAFRELSFGGPLARGLNELTLGDLASADPFQFHFRLALALAPLTLGFFSLALATVFHRALRARPAPLAATVAICFMYYMLSWGSRPGGLLSPGGAAVTWVPNVLFSAVAVVLFQMRAPAAADPSRRGA